MLDVILSGRRVRHHRRTIIGRIHWSGTDSFLLIFRKLRLNPRDKIGKVRLWPNRIVKHVFDPWLPLLARLVIKSAVTTHALYICHMLLKNSYTNYEKLIHIRMRRTCTNVLSFSISMILKYVIETKFWTIFSYIVQPAVGFSSQKAASISTLNSVYNCESVAAYVLILVVSRIK